MDLLPRSRQGLIYLWKFAEIYLFWYLLISLQLAIVICTRCICIVANRQSPDLTDWKSPWYFSCVHSNPASSTGIFTWKYHSDELFSMRGTIQLCTPYCHIWYDKNMRKIFPVVPSWLSHIPRVCLSITRNHLLLLIFNGPWVARGIIIPKIKCSSISLD